MEDIFGIHLNIFRGYLFLWYKLIILVLLGLNQRIDWHYVLSKFLLILKLCHFFRGLNWVFSTIYPLFLKDSLNRLSHLNIFIRFFEVIHEEFSFKDFNFIYLSSTIIPQYFLKSFQKYLKCINSNDHYQIIVTIWRFQSLIHWISFN